MAGAGAEVDDPVGVRHHRLVVLDDDHGLAGVDEPVEQAEQLLDVGEVQAGRRLVEDVDAALARPCRVASLSRCRSPPDSVVSGWPSAEVAEADVGEPVEDGVRGRACARRRRRRTPRPRHRHREHLADVAAAEVVARAPTAWNRLPSQSSQVRGDAGHHRQVGVDDAGAVAGGAGALGVGAEQRGLDAVGLGEGLADRVEQPGVGGRVAAPGAADRGLVDRDHAVARRPREPWMRELLPEPATPVTTTRTPSGMSTSTSRRLWVRGAADLQRAGRACAAASLSAARSSRWRPVMVSLARSPATVPSKQIVPPSAPAPGPRSTTWSAMRDGLRLVLDDEHRVALVAQPQQQVVHPLRCRAGAGRWSARRRRR